jgi:hypothetical protein
VSRRNSSSASSRHANHSRRGWIRPLRRARRAIDASLRRIDCSCRVIDASERFGGRRPVQAADQLQRVFHWLADAATQLDRAQIRLRDTSECIESAPECAAGAPLPMMSAILHWIDAAGRLTAVSERLGDTSTGLVAVAKVAQPSDFRPVIAAPRPAAARWFLWYCPSHPSDRIRVLLKRRRRSAPALVADAPRRISRGRAPPFVSICLL